MTPIQPSNHNPMREAHDAPRCQHIRLTGRRCAAPALRGRRLCYFHQRMLRPKKRDYTLPFVEDATSLQFAFMQMLRALQDKEYDPKICGLMLYNLQIVSSNLDRFIEEQTEPEFDIENSAEHNDDEDPEGESLAATLLRLLRTLDTDDPPADAAPPAQLAAGPAKGPVPPWKQPDVYPEAERNRHRQPEGKPLV